MGRYICVTCGTEYPDSARPLEACRTCLDPRQFVNWSGQAWTGRTELAAGHKNRFGTEEFGVEWVVTEPQFAIGQRAFLIQTPSGNVLWDCLSLIDQATVNWIKRRGGAMAMAISHPHFYSAMASWSEALGGIPVYLHANDREHVVQAPAHVEYWQGDRFTLLPGVTLLRTGGHFEGSAVLHFSAGAGGKGALFPGDSIRVAMDRRWVCFMRSYVNFVPLGAKAINGILAAIEGFPFDRLYGYWPGFNVIGEADTCVRRSAERHLAAISS